MTEQNTQKWRMLCGQVLAVFAGGTLGTAIRAMFGQSALLGLSTANVLACFLMGAVCRLLPYLKLKPQVQALLVTGFLGGLSTIALPVLMFFYEGEPDAVAAAWWQMVPQVLLMLLEYLLPAAAGYGCAALGHRVLKRKAEEAAEAEE